MKSQSFCISQALIAAVCCADTAYSATDEESELCNDADEMSAIADRIASSTSLWSIENTINILKEAYSKKVN